MKQTFVLKMKCGVEVTATFDDEIPEFVCEWEPAPPWKPNKAKKIFAEYEPWRNKIFEEWSKRTGKKILVITT